MRKSIMIPELSFDKLLKTTPDKNKLRLLVSWYKQDTTRLFLPYKHVQFCFMCLEVSVSDRTITRAKQIIRKQEPYKKSDTVRYWLRQNDYYINKPITIIQDALASCGVNADYRTIRKLKLELDPTYKVKTYCRRFA
jgi:hypothetical protein